MNLSVVIPTHNPRREPLRRTLGALKRQTLPPSQWECLLVDNASTPPLDLAAFADVAPRSTRIYPEPRLGLTAARSRGIVSAVGEILVFVDDDNVLAPDYLEHVHQAFAADAKLGAAGGRTLPEFENPPAAWIAEFQGLLALRDLGDAPMRAAWTTVARHYPLASPIGAGMALRRSAALRYLDAIASDSTRQSLDRTGTALVSGGDNDLVMTILEQGLEIAYLPQLKLTHLIPDGRCTMVYLGALNRAIARSWIRVLALHGIYPWTPIRRTGVRPRILRAWWVHSAWRGPAQWVRWQGACGCFEGRADLRNSPSAR